MWFFLNNNKIIMNLILKLKILLLLIIFSSQVKGQVLISLLFGEALNSDKIEFGLVGGFNRSWIYDLDESKGLNSFNIGFYFHIMLKENSFLSTGVLVKSNVGVSGMPTYPIGDDDFDSVFVDGELTKKINYFYVPILYQQRFKNRWYIEGGFQLGLRNKAYDIFEIEAYGGDVSFKVDARDDYKYLDAGLMGGVGYKLKRRLKSSAVGINYYYGLMNISKVPEQKMKNSALYVYFKIPIGAGMKELPEDE
jgi:hypothetical protein